MQASDITTGAITIEDIVSKTQDLPTMPAAALAVMRETEDPESTANTVARHLAQDQALTARVLRLANSAFYGLPRQVTSAQDAVVVLGMRAVKNLSLIASTYPWLSKPLVGYAMEPMELWRHSFAVGVGAQYIADKTRTADSDEAFTSGLLHDLGKLALSVWLEDKIGPMLEVSRRGQMPFEDVERKVLGFDHAEVGAFMGESWNLPPQIVKAMKFHHRPHEMTPPSTLVDCVHVADYMSVHLGIGSNIDDLPHELDLGAMERLALTLDDLECLAEGYVESFHEQERLLAEAK